jgi:hypothetical protein
VVLLVFFTLHSFRWEYERAFFFVIKSIQGDHLSSCFKMEAGGHERALHSSDRTGVVDLTPIATDEGCDQGDQYGQLKHFPAPFC